MDRFNQLKTQYENQARELRILFESILDDGELFDDIMKEHLPDLFEVHEDPKQEYTYLNKIIKKYESPMSYKFPGARFGGHHPIAQSIGGSLIDHVNEKYVARVSQILGQRRARRNALKKIRKQNK